MKKEIVIKDNTLINSSYSLNLTEQRLILFCVCKSNESGIKITEKDNITIYVKDFIAMFGVDKTSGYRDLKNACDSILNRKFSYDYIDEYGLERTRKSNWLQHADYAKNEAVIDIKFTESLIPFIGYLEERINYTSYFIDDVAKMTSVYAIRLYELIIAWKSTRKTPLIRLEELREKLGILPNEYKAMCDFKKRVFDIAISQINEHSNICIVANQHKKGRSIIGFSFNFVEIKKTTERDPNTRDWVDEAKKTKRKKITINQLVSKYPSETRGKTEPELYKMFGNKYHII